jgi:hypothetical protein
MPDISDGMHQRILATLDNARADVAALGESSKPVAGYLGFELVDMNLAQCRASLQGVKDRDTVMRLLRTLAAVIQAYGGGNVAPAVTRARTTLEDLWKGLEPRAPG